MRQHRLLLRICYLRYTLRHYLGSILHNHLPNHLSETGLDGPETPCDGRPASLLGFSTENGTFTPLPR
jgi:hypothetical protein